MGTIDSGPVGISPSRRTSRNCRYRFFLPVDHAINRGIALANCTGAKVTGLTVLPPFHIFTAEYADRTLGAIARLARKEGIACQEVHVEHDFPYQAIINTAGSKGCDLLVMASHGRRGISAIVLGSETVKVLRR
jgi:nucleotide-binding universal stress UspA family protein